MKYVLLLFLFCLGEAVYSQDVGQEPLNLIDYNIGLMFCNGDIISVKFDFSSESVKREVFIESNNVYLKVSFFDSNKNLLSIENYIFGSYKSELCWLAHGEHVSFKGKEIVGRRNFDNGVLM